MSLQSATKSNCPSTAFFVVLAILARCSGVSNQGPALEHDKDLSIRDISKLPKQQINQSPEFLKELKKLLLSDMDWKGSLLSAKEYIILLQELGDVLASSGSYESKEKLSKFTLKIGAYLGSLRKELIPLEFIFFVPIALKNKLTGRNEKEIETQINTTLKTKIDRNNHLLDEAWYAAFKLEKIFENIRIETKSFGATVNSVNSAAKLLENIDAQTVQAKEFCYHVLNTLDYLYVSRQIVLFYGREQYLSLSEIKSENSQDHLNTTKLLIEENVQNMDRVYITLKSILSSFSEAYIQIVRDSQSIPTYVGLTEDERKLLNQERQNATRDVHTSSQDWARAFDSV